MVFITNIEKIDLSSLSPLELEKLADKILNVNSPKQTKLEQLKEYPIQTRNRDATIYKRETSLEFTLENSPQTSLSPLKPNSYFLDYKESLTPEDKQNPKISAILKTIESLELQLQHATIKKIKYQLKKQIIENWKLIYDIKSKSKIAHIRHPNNDHNIPIVEDIIYWKDDIPHSDSPFSFLSPKAISNILPYYHSMRSELEGAFTTDMYYLLLDLEDLIERAPLSPFLRQLLELKSQHYTNKDVEEYFLQKNIKHNHQYYSLLYRQRIPNILAKQAQKDYVYNYYKNNNLAFRICKTCGQRKPLHKFYYDPTPQGSFYHSCKNCRKQHGIHNNNR